MSFYRNYTPAYTGTPEEKVAEVKQKIKESYHKFFIEKNPAPYNCHWLEQNIDIEHYTMWYSPKIGKERLNSKREEYRRMWFDNREVADCNRSVDYPHVHFVRKTPSI